MKRALFMASGVIIWALHFTAIYGYAGLACARRWDSTVTWVVSGATVVGVIAVMVPLVAGWRGRERFEHGIASGLAAFALLAILWEGASVAFLVPCRG
jgi:ABC-type glycerol-3-phosphate transport system permease component